MYGDVKPCIEQRCVPCVFVSYICCYQVPAHSWLMLFRNLSIGVQIHIGGGGGSLS